MPRAMENSGPQHKDEDDADDVDEILRELVRYLARSAAERDHAAALNVPDPTKDSSGADA